MKFDRDFFQSLSFRVMTPSDREGFAGCNSPVPLIADSGEFLVIVDGCYAEIYNADDIENCSGPSVQIDNICDLPYSWENTIDLGSGLYDQRPGDPEYFASDL